MGKEKKKFWLQGWFWLLVASVVYLTFRLINLTILPVFADEAIYIRWSQLIISDPAQYWFFPMNDGKTPLQMWLMIPFLEMIKDPLWAGRFLSVLAGLMQMWLIYLTVAALDLNDRKATRISQIAGLVLAIFTPFWFFYQRMALTDALLSLTFFLMIWTALKLLKKERWSWGWLIGGALAVGAGFYTKIPAVLFLPTLGLLAFWQPQKKWQDYWRPLVKVAAMVAGGVLLFALLKITPVFGQLFARGGDFLLPFNEIMTMGLGGVLNNFGAHLKDLAQICHQYLAWSVVLVPLMAAIFVAKNRRTYLLLFLATLSFVLPIALLGKVTYPRYYLPMAVPITLMAALAIGDLINLILLKTATKSQRVLSGVIVVAMSLDLIMTAVLFIGPALTDPAWINFNRVDAEQYLEEWSSGYGIKETVNRIEIAAKKKKVLVLTEGYFGTLPDAINMYLFKHDVSNIHTEGIGQPVYEVPEKMVEKMSDYDETWLVVNSHRMKMDLPEENLITEYCRPNYTAPCLQLWRLK